MCKNWKYKTICTKQELQSLLGTLLYITKCVKPARYFLNRMLCRLRDSHSRENIFLNMDFAADLNWFNTFLSDFNGVTFYDNKPVFATIELDACLTGFGGVFANMVYHLPIPKNFRKYNIAQLELLNVLVALKVWAANWSDKKIHIKCDNIASVEVLKMGKARDTVMATIARNIWLITAKFNIHFSCYHIAGIENRTADLLSRWSYQKADYKKLHQLIQDPVWMPCHIDLTLLNENI